MEESPPTPEYLQETLSSECWELVSSLPREKGWVKDHIYQYEGFWYQPKHLQGIFGCREHFRARDTDTILVTNPKSGTTWLKAMAYAVLNRSTFSIDRDHPLHKANPHNLVPGLDYMLYCDNNKVPDLSSFASPRLFGSHLPIGALPWSIKDSSCKIVYLCRNPKDMFVSMFHFVNKLRPEGKAPHKLEVLFDKFCDGISPYGPVWDHALGYWRESLENPRKVLFMKYEEVKEQPTSQLRSLAEFLECPFSPEEESQGMVDDIARLCSFDHLSNLEVNKVGETVIGMPPSSFFRGGKVGDFKNLFTSEMTEKIDRITQLKIGDSNLKF